jgi:hypothetical protein
MLPVVVEDVDYFLFRFSNAVLKSCGIGCDEICKVGIISPAHQIGGCDRCQIVFNAFDRTDQCKIDMCQLILEIIVDVVKYHILQFVRKKCADRC